MEIQRASVYKVFSKNGFLIHSVSSTQGGPGIATAPFVWLPGDSPMVEVVEQMKNAMRHSKAGLPIPDNWKEGSRKFFKSIGLKTKSDFYKGSTLISVHTKDGSLFFTPMKSDNRGFVGTKLIETVPIPSTSSTETIAQTMENLFDALGKL